MQRGGFFGRYLPSGHLVYMRQDTLFAAPMDLEKLELTGPSVPVLEEVANIPGRGSAQFDFSRTGTFVYVSGKGRAAGGRSRGSTPPVRRSPSWPRPAAITASAFRRMANAWRFPVGGALGRSNLAVYDWQRDTMTRLGSTPGPDDWPVWTPDGKGIVYRSRSAGGLGLYWVRSDGASASVLLTESKKRPGAALVLARRKAPRICRKWRRNAGVTFGRCPSTGATPNTPSRVSRKSSSALRP